ncbi:MAG: hypothetical protein PVF43_10200 [Candidatus Eiseniibacteriota bacterium]|jgi:hypothetical protein
MTPEVVFALYRPHAGKDAELRALIREHLPALRELGLVTDRPALLVRGQDGTYIEIFEWRSREAAKQAHDRPAVARLWEAMGRIADFPALGELQEGGERFPHFQPVDL